MGWSDTYKLRTPPAAGSDETSFVIYGDMGKAPLDTSVEHYIQVYQNVASVQKLISTRSFVWRLQIYTSSPKKRLADLYFAHGML